MRSAIVLLAVMFAPALARYKAINVPVGKGPVDVLVNPATNKIYTADARGGSITVIDGGSNLVKATIALPISPAALCVNQFNNKVYASGARSPYLAVIDGDRDSLLACPYLGRGCVISALCNNPASNDVYCGARDQVLVIDGRSNELKELIPVTPNHFRDMCYNPANDRIYCVGDSAPGVTVIDGATNTADAAILTGVYHHALCWARRENRIYCASPGRVTVIDCGLNKVVGTIELRDSAPNVVCYNPANRRVYCFGGVKAKRAIVIDCMTGDTSSLAASQGANAAVVDPIHNRIYVTSYRSRDLTVIDGVTHGIAKVSAEMTPRAVAVNPTTGIAYVANDNNNTVSVIIENPSETDVRIADMKQNPTITPFGSTVLDPSVMLRSTGLTPSGFTLTLEIFDVTDPKTAIRVPVYAESVVVWELMGRTWTDVRFPQFGPEPGKYEAIVRITGFLDATPADNRRTVHWRISEPVKKEH